MSSLHGVHDTAHHAVRERTQHLREMQTSDEEMSHLQATSSAHAQHVLGKPDPEIAVSLLQPEDRM